MPRLVSIPGGVLQMGSDLPEIDACAAYWGERLIDPSYRADFRRWLMKEYPRHAVTVRPFRIGMYPVTNGEYAAFVAACAAAAPESLRSGEPADCPVWGVTFAEATAYTRWLAARDGVPYRLPSEAEWEFAARGTSTREYPFGAAFDAARCNTREAGVGRTTPVDRYPQGASEFGVFDLAGNVEEWTSDFYAPYPGGEFVSDDLSALLGEYRVLRGGSFALGGDLGRCARRHGPHPAPQFRFIGFRVAASEAT